MQSQEARHGIDHTQAVSFGIPFVYGWAIELGQLMKHQSRNKLTGIIDLK